MTGSSTILENFTEIIYRHDWIHHVTSKKRFVRLWPRHHN